MKDNSPTTQQQADNPFMKMGFIQFWLVATLFWLSFPFSLGISYVALGSVKTKQLIKALIHDFIQTVLILIAVFCLFIAAIWYGISALLGG